MNNTPFVNHTQWNPFSKYHKKCWNLLHPIFLRYLLFIFFVGEMIKRKIRYNLSNSNNSCINTKRFEQTSNKMNITHTWIFEILFMKCFKVLALQTHCMNQKNLVSIKAISTEDLVIFAKYQTENLKSLTNKYSVTWQNLSFFKNMNVITKLFVKIFRF